MSSKEALRLIESRINRVSEEDQKENGRQVNEGKTEKWKNYFSANEVEEIECFLNKFRLSLNEF